MAFAPQTETGLLLTNMLSSRMWLGWKRTLSWIHDTDTNNRLSGQDTLAKDCSTDLNDVIQSASTTLYSNTTEKIQEHTLLNADTTQPKHRFKLMDENGQFNVATVFDLLVEDECDNPIMLEWVNELGANEQYLFSFNQDIDEMTDPGIVFTPPIVDDYQTINNAIGREFQDTNQLITLGTVRILPQNLRALHYLKVSEEVHIWLNKDGTTRQRVIIDSTFSTPYTTRDRYSDFDVRIRLPLNYDFFKAKLY